MKVQEQEIIQGLGNEGIKQGLSKGYWKEALEWLPSRNMQNKLKFPREMQGQKDNIMS